MKSMLLIGFFAVLLHSGLGEESEKTPCDYDMEGCAIIKSPITGDLMCVCDTEDDNTSADNDESNDEPSQTTDSVDKRAGARAFSSLMYPGSRYSGSSFSFGGPNYGGGYKRGGGRGFYRGTNHVWSDRSKKNSRYYLGNPYKGTGGARYRDTPNFLKYKRGGGRGFVGFSDMAKRGGGRYFHGGPPANFHQGLLRGGNDNYASYYGKRAGGRASSIAESGNALASEFSKRGGGRAYSSFANSVNDAAPGYWGMDKRGGGRMFRDARYYSGRGEYLKKRGGGRGFVDAPSHVAPMKKKAVAKKASA